VLSRSGKGKGAAKEGVRNEEGPLRARGLVGISVKRRSAALHAEKDDRREW